MVHDERSGCPRSHQANENVERMQNLAHSDRCLSVTAMAMQPNLGKQWKRPELWPNNWILHCDNAPANKALSVKQFLAQKSITEMEHPPFSPDLAHTHTMPIRSA